MTPSQTCLDETADGQEHTVVADQTFEICLRENPTTGYRWRLDASGAPVVALIGDTFETSGGPPGAGGVHRWRFRASAPGSASIALSSRRPWEPDDQSGRTFALFVRIEP